MRSFVIAWYDPDIRRYSTEPIIPARAWVPYDDDEEALCETCGGSGELPCDEDTCCCEGGHPCPACQF
jgi:hypothetical protein